MLTTAEYITKSRRKKLLLVRTFLNAYSTVG